MTRYFMYISYIGTRFRSVQKQVIFSDPSKLDTDSVQGILEISLKRFCPSNEPKIYLSSRTDQGVHALRSGVHVDLERRSGFDYDPEFLIYALNRCFEKGKIDVRIQSCRIVPPTFHARHNAKMRTYLYRLAVRRSDAPPLDRGHIKYTAEIPFAEVRRCHFIQETEFDVEKLKVAAALFPGVKNFRTFMGAHRDYHGIPTTRPLYSLEINPGQPMLSPEYCPSYSYYNFWDITCSAKSFLYRQVRRTVGALIAVAQGRLSLHDIQYMLDNPSPDSWNPKAVPVPAYGLYLLNVAYDPADMQIPQVIAAEEHIRPTEIGG